VSQVAKSNVVEPLANSLLRGDVWSLATSQVGLQLSFEIARQVEAFELLRRLMPFFGQPDSSAPARTGGVEIDLPIGGELVRRVFSDAVATETLTQLAHSSEAAIMADQVKSHLPWALWRISMLGTTLRHRSIEDVIDKNTAAFLVESPAITELAWALFERKREEGSDLLKVYRSGFWSGQYLDKLWNQDFEDGLASELDDPNITAAQVSDLAEDLYLGAISTFAFSMGSFIALAGAITATVADQVRSPTTGLRLPNDRRPDQSVETAIALASQYPTEMLVRVDSTSGQLGSPILQEADRRLVMYRPHTLFCDDLHKEVQVTADFFDLRSFKLSGDREQASSIHQQVANNLLEIDPGKIGGFPLTGMPARLMSRIRTADSQSLSYKTEYLLDLSCSIGATLQEFHDVEFDYLTPPNSPPEVNYISRDRFSLASDLWKQWNAMPQRHRDSLLRIAGLAYSTDRYKGTPVSAIDVWLALLVHSLHQIAIAASAHSADIS